MLEQILGSKFLSNFLANRITSELVGGKSNKEALMFTALQQGLGGDNPFSDMFGSKKTPETEQMSALQNATAGDPRNLGGSEGYAPNVVNEIAKKGIAAIDPISTFQQAEGTLGYADFLINAGILEPDSKIAQLLNSRVGEALATSLAAGLGSKLGGSNGGSNYEPRPFGGTGNTSLNMPIRAAQGGYIDGQYFPRRNGGIMPSEGSGQKDDVPAMLMAGEFVLTKDAVKGLGNGNSQQGIQKAYSLMNQLEDKVA